MRYVIAFICLVAAFGLRAQGKQASFLERLLSRSVTVETEEGHGAGVIMSSGFVLTNFHLLHSRTEITVAGKPAHVVKIDPKNDLLLLATETPSFPLLKIAQQINLDQEIACVGNPLEHTGMITRGRIIALDNDSVYTDAHLFFGSSGGGAYNLDGELVGIVRGIEGKSGDGFPYGVIVPASVVRAFIESPRPKDISSQTNKVAKLQ